MNMAVDRGQKLPENYHRHLRNVGANGPQMLIDRVGDRMDGRRLLATNDQQSPPVHCLQVVNNLCNPCFAGFVVMMGRCASGTAPQAGENLRK